MDSGKDDKKDELKKFVFNCSSHSRYESEYGFNQIHVLPGVLVLCASLILEKVLFRCISHSLDVTVIMIFLKFL